MASSCVFVWYLVARRINPRLFPLNVANVSFVLRCGALVSRPNGSFSARTAKSPARGRAFQEIRCLQGA
jgi:hypothetical protein